MMKNWKKGSKTMGMGCNSGHVYGLGMIGAAVYYLHTTVGFGPSVVALLKAIVWPAFLVYHLLAR